MKKKKRSDPNNKRDEVMLVKEKIKLLESENIFSKNDINMKQK